MQTIKIQCPAKINLDLRVVNKRNDGFHNIESIMQTISLYDYLKITAIDSCKTQISLDGNSSGIPYNETNLVYKAAKLYLEITGLSANIDVYIEKNIPVSAGLAGGSTDAAGIIFGLNKLFGEKLTGKELHLLCTQLGSDLNLCLAGGRVQTRGRGEILDPLEFKDFNVNLIKPDKLGLSAKYAYNAFSEKIKLPDVQISRKDFRNDLEWAVIDDFPQLLKIKSKYPSAIMTGSGSTYFSTEEEFKKEAGYWIKNGLKAIEYGVKIADDQ